MGRKKRAQVECLGFCVGWKIQTGKALKCRLFVKLGGFVDRTLVFVDIMDENFKNLVHD